MSNNFFNVSKPKIQRLPTLKKDTVAIYVLPKDTNGRYILFNKEQLVFLYHLLRFNYFDREIAENIYYISTRKEKLSLRTFQKFIGNKSYPLSIYEKKEVSKKITNKKLYYVNKKFASWLLDELLKHADILKLLSVTEFNNSFHSLSANNIEGGKPKSINYHDYTIRKLMSHYARNISKSLINNTVDELNIQISFPVNKKISNILPDSTMFVFGKPFYFEYDNDTEQQYRLLSKVIRYIENTPFYDTNIYFIFKVADKKDDLSISKRIETFSNNVSSNYYHDIPFLEHLKTNKINIYAYPIFQSVEPVKETILKKSLPNFQSILDVNLINNFSGFPYFVDELIKTSSDSDFDYVIKCQNDDFDTIEIPIKLFSYSEIGNSNKLQTLKQKYQHQYQNIAILFFGGLKTQFENINDNYFIPIYI